MSYIMFVQPSFRDFAVQRSTQQCWLAAAGMQQGRASVMWAGCAFPSACVALRTLKEASILLYDCHVRPMLCSCNRSQPWLVAHICNSALPHKLTKTLASSRCDTLEPFLNLAPQRLCTSCHADQEEVRLR